MRRVAESVFVFAICWLVRSLAVRGTRTTFHLPCRSAHLPVCLFDVAFLSLLACLFAYLKVTHHVQTTICRYPAFGVEDFYDVGFLWEIDLLADFTLF